ncbi:MAG: DNA primase [Nitrospirae bacterium]|nr:DNA primase [Nitrospirota bacterium]
MADVVEDVKARLDIVEVVGAYVQLKKAGRNYKGLCPFHSEKTPSFVVSPEKQICHCFGCNKGGDMFNFIEEVEGAEFTEALQILADKAGVKIDNVSKFAKKEGKGEKDEYFKAHNLACEFFERQLYKTDDGKKVLEYLYKRGMKDETIKEFKVGFSSNQYDALYPYLMKKGISKRVLMKSGFVSAKGVGSDEIFDKFRGRLMFPIFDYLGRVCGFGGRALNKDQMPKYLNSPENRVYNKSRLLYGLYHSKASVKENDKIILVEGYFDVILPYQEGIKNIAAVSGTALTSDQATLIKRLTGNVVTCFDLDKAGFEATKRSYSILSNVDFVVKTVSGFEGKDPADLVKDKGGKEFMKFVEKAVSFISFYVDRLLETNNIETFEGRHAVIKELLPLLKKMTASSKDFHVRELATKLGMKEQFLYDELESFSLPADHPAREKAGSGEKAEGFSLEQVICGIVLGEPKLFKILLEKVNKNDFNGIDKDVYKALYDQYNKARNGLREWNLDKGFLAGIREKLDILLLYVEEKYGALSEKSVEDEVEKLVDKMKRTRINKQLDDLRIQIVEAEKNDEKEKLIELLKEQQKLLSDN